MRWSRRSSWPREASELSLALGRARARGDTLVDLSESNPTRCGLAPTEAEILRLADPRGTVYQPVAVGMREAREAVARYYARRGLRVDPARVVLAASSSEIYGWLFKLACDPGDRLLVPRPSYPLLPFLAGLEAIQLVDYPLMQPESWRVDVAAVRRALAEDERLGALVMVHPSNPCGALVRRDDALEVGRALAEHGAALVVDEVFLDYPLGAVDRSRQGSFATFGDDSGSLCFSLSGLSKVALAPQLKLAWVVVSGPQSEVDEALERLELIADTYLSVSTAVQLAASAILDEADGRQQLLRQRLALNLAALDRAIDVVGADVPVRRLPADAGWYALLQVPRTRSDDDWVSRLIERERLVVHPGHHFGVEERGILVVSLLPQPEVFAEAIARAVRCWVAG